MLVTGADANNNSISCSIEATVQTAGFTLNADPDWLDTTAGGDDVTSTIAIDPIGSFTGNVTVAVTQIIDPNGNDVTQSSPITCWFDSSDDTTSSGLNVPNSESDTLNVTAGQNCGQGYYTITLTGTDSNNNTATTEIDVYVVAGFVLNASPQNLTIAPGGRATSSISALSAGDATGTAVSLTATVYDADGNAVTGGSVTAKFGNCTGGTTGLTGNAQVAVGDGSDCPVTVNVEPSVAAGSTYEVDVTGTDPAGNTEDVWIDVTVQSPGLTLKATPQAVSVTAGGSSAVSTLTVAPLGGLTGTATLSATSPADRNGKTPSGLTIGINPTAVTLGGSQWSLATITADGTVPEGEYTSTVTATCGSYTATATITMDVRDMSMTLSEGGWEPTDNPYVGVAITDKITADIEPSPTTATSISYDWTAGPVWFSVDDTTANPFALDSSGDYTLAWPDTANPGPTATDTTLSDSDTLTGVFSSIGWYIVEVECTATITYEDRSHTALTGSYYIGGYPTQTTGTTSSDATIKPMQVGAGGKKVHPKGAVIDIETKSSPTLYLVQSSTPVAGSGVTQELYVTSEQLYAGTKTITINVSAPQGLGWSLYDPAHRIVGGNTVTVASGQRSHALILSLYIVDAGISPGTYPVTITATGAGTGTKTLSVTVANKTAQDPGATSHDINPSYGPYYGEDAITPAFAMTITVNLPQTDSNDVSLVKYYTEDAADIYLGGSTGLDEAGNTLDVGLTLGHTGNSGWDLFCTNAGGPTIQQGTIAPGNVTLTFEAPGFHDAVHGILRNGTGILIVNGVRHEIDGINWTDNAPHIGYYLKFMHSIAQQHAEGSFSFNITGEYTSGSYLHGVEWGTPQLFMADGTAIANPAFTIRYYPHPLYTSPSTLRTLP